MKFIIFNGIKYYQQKNGYYQRSETAKRNRENIERRLHRAIWKHFKGEIPKGYHIHHIDENKENNDISNLELLSPSEHQKKHTRLSKIWWHTEKGKRANRKGIRNAKKWHSSESGKLWHSMHQYIYINKIRVVEICKECGQSFGTFKDKRHQEYCRKCRDKFLHRELYKRKMGYFDK